MKELEINHKHICGAWLNWENWKDQFEAAPGLQNLPMLRDDSWKDFVRFTAEYGLARGIPGKAKAGEAKPALREVQCFLRGKDTQWLASTSLEEKSDELCSSIKKMPGFDQETGVKAQRSLISKVMSMSEPDKYPMFDHFAREGLGDVLEKSTRSMKILKMILIKYLKITKAK